MNERPVLTLQRGPSGSDANQLGLILRGASDGSGALEVAAFAGAGLIPNMNRTTGGGAICVGDLLVDVNGKKDMASMALEIATAPVLNLTVRTWGDANGAP